MNMKSPCPICDLLPAPAVERHASGFTALMHACEWGDLGIVQGLVTNGGADVNAKETGGFTALMYGVEHLDVVRFLLEKTDTDELGMRDDNDATVLMHACESGNLDVVQYLVANGGADVKAKDNFGRTALMDAAENGHVDVVEYLVDVGADPREKDDDGYTALMHAAENQKWGVVEFLATPCVLCRKKRRVD